ncbi:MAG TPA: NTP transferase domain-containing protein [Steroidobacteraceae bacterium]|nr:NTP transferase domain-containing protein [Steroidobacteraceae bacterium]
MTPLFGLLLAGGRSSRMRSDKAALAYGARPHLAESFDLLARHVGKAFVSVRADQAAEPLRARYPQLLDGNMGRGPIAGIIAAQARHPEAAWLVLACDLPFLDDATLASLIARRDADRLATAFASRHDGLPEPLCAIYEPASRAAILAHVAGGRDCPRKFLVENDILLLDPVSPAALDNANTPEDAAAARAVLAGRGAA